MNGSKLTLPYLYQSQNTHTSTHKIKVSQRAHLTFEDIEVKAQKFSLETFKHSFFFHLLYWDLAIYVWFKRMDSNA